MTRCLSILLLLIPAATYAQGIGGIATRAFGAREWREAVATVGALPTCDTGSGINSENGVLRYVIAEQALYRCSGGAWAVALAAGGGSGDIEAVGDCATGTCFSSVTARHAFLGPAGGGVASFRALVEADISDLAHTVDTDNQDSTEVPYTPTTAGDWTDPDPTNVGEALDDLAASGGGSPGGSDRQVQFNNAGAFGGSAAVSIDANSVLSLTWPGSGWPFGEAMKITTTGQTLSFFQSGSGGRAQVYSTNRLSLQGGNGLASIELADGGANTIKMMDRVVDSPSTAVCANSGDVSLGTLFISPTTSYVEITNSDADGCTLTMAEPGTGGQRLTLALAATAGGVVTLSDTPGVVNLSADWTPGAGDTLEATYSQTRSEWLETSRSDN